MKAKSVTVGSERTFVLVLDQGEEAFRAITDFANKEQVSGAAVTAIGAFAHAQVGWFDLAAKSYKRIAVSEQCGVLSLIGDVGLQDGSVRGGHFLSGPVRPTLEVTINETVEHMRRKKAP